MTYLSVRESQLVQSKLERNMWNRKSDKVQNRSLAENTKDTAGSRLTKIVQHSVRTMLTTGGPRSEWDVLLRTVCITPPTLQQSWRMPCSFQSVHHQGWIRPGVVYMPRRDVRIQMSNNNKKFDCHRPRNCVLRWETVYSNVCLGIQQGAHCVHKRARII